MNMKVFVTGATGFVGTAVVQELIKAGHQVLGLTHSDAGAKSLAAAGAKVHRGDVEDLDSLRRGVDASDGVIHTAFNHDFSKFKANCETDRLAIDALGSALAGSDRPLIITSATGVVPPGGLATETMPASGSTANPRAASEEAADSVATRGVPVSVVRLGVSVHGDGDHAFVPMLIKIAREKGVSVYQGDGLNRWPAVHRLDAAHLFRLALEMASPAGTRFHGVAEEGIAFREIAELIGKRLNIPVVSKSKEEAATHFGWFAFFAAMNNPTSSARTQEFLGWKPQHPGLIVDLDRESYFTT